MMPLRFLALTAAILTLGTTVSAQQTATQKFTVNVPTNITITAPTNLAIAHDQSNANQPFPLQTWSVVGNTAAGVNVSLAIAQPFTHVTDATHKRDAIMALTLKSKTGPANWTINQATDTTDYANNDQAAAVTVTSNGTGAAQLDLAISFVTGTFGSFAAGAYETTVTGTVTAN